MTEENIKEIGTHSVAEVFNLLIPSEYPFAIWRLPNNERFNCLISENKNADLKKIDLEELPSGFAFAPFNYSDQNQSVFLSSDIAFEFSSFNESIEIETQDKLSQLIDLNSANTGLEISKHVKLVFDETQEDKESFQSIVLRATRAIQEGLFDKVVLSRRKQIDKPKSFNPIDHFKNLCKTYPALFCSLIYLPWDEEIWIGSTPESLVEQNENGIFKTMALAGTQASVDANGQEISAVDALWRQKEIEEQAFVSRYIINCFKKIRVREFTEIGPKSVQAGNLIHLQTAFEVDTKAIEFPQMGTVMIDLLHPTSAVCGMPKEASQVFIKENENYDRKFYAGFLGPVNIENRTNLFVNLRTLQVKGDQINLFAGSGITCDSDPEKEWKETEIKLKTVSV